MPVPEVLEVVDVAGLTAAVIVVSDEVASGADADRGGPVAVALLRDLGVAAEKVAVPDDPPLIRTAITAAIEDGARVVLACGGTGIGPHDHTADVVAELLTFEMPGIAEEIRRQGYGHTPIALVSREIAGVVRPEQGQPVLLLAVPGSRGGIRDALGVVGPMLGYIIDQLDGAGHT